LFTSEINPDFRSARKNLEEKIKKMKITSLNYETKKENKGKQKISIDRFNMHKKQFHL